MATSIGTINPALPAAFSPAGKGRMARAAAALALAAGLGAAPAFAGWVGNVELLTRGDGRVLPVYERDGRKWVVGTPGQVADEWARYVRTRAVDGFNISPHLIPAALDDLVDRLVPELQDRGVYRTEYEGSTLREHLELP